MTDRNENMIFPGRKSVSGNRYTEIRDAADAGKTERSIAMSERSIDKREKEYNDSIPDPEEEFPESDEETYRDGSVKNECWAEKGSSGGERRAEASEQFFRKTDYKDCDYRGTVRREDDSTELDSERIY